MNRTLYRLATVKNHRADVVAKKHEPSAHESTLAERKASFATDSSVARTLRYHVFNGLSRRRRYSSIYEYERSWEARGGARLAVIKREAEAEAAAAMARREEEIMAAV